MFQKNGVKILKNLHKNKYFLIFPGRTHQKAFRPVHKVELSAHKVYKVHKVTGVLRTRFTGSYAAVDKAPARVHKPYE
ncbi:hypothetical protein, partial [uncultured Butyricimonas sp.]|uniref:hypothetical protein n=1 Tax=uncultured Butyricimonas sp. TaxID=1268785 RepID=UPI0026DC8EFA